MGGETSAEMLRPRFTREDGSMPGLMLSAEEIISIESLVATVAKTYGSAEDPEFLMESTLLAHELPRRLRAALNSFRLLEPDSALFVVSGYPVNQDQIGPTPEHWQRPPEARPAALQQDLFFILACSLLGDCIGWQTQQNGRIIHDVVPIKGMEQEQIGTGSEQAIWWHTEDAFHPLHGDYLAMMCLRNPDRVATTFASLERLPLDPDDLEALFEPRYAIRPDNSHIPANGAGGDSDARYSRIEQMLQQPEKIAVLSGDPRSPYIRIDPYFMDPVEDDPRAQRALAALIAAIDARLHDVVLAPGDISIIDNRKAVHGRRAFKARYDGRDRWLRRTNITRDLRKSRQARATPTSRIIQ
jgi:Fe(II)/alpha-ketoglutarate-dependent arginine beta-hydroxylase